MATGQLSSVISKIRRLVVPHTTIDDDAQLLDRFARDRDESAFAELMRRHSPLVMSVCRRVLIHAQDAEDAYQATFLVLVRKAPSLRREGSLASYLHTVAYHLALKIRAQAVKRRCEGEIEAVAAKPQTDESTQAELKPVLDEEVHRLPEKYRTPFILCYLEGKTNAEAAEQLGCPQGTIFTRLSRARDMLRTRLERRGLALTSAALAALCTAQSGNAAVSHALFDSTLQAAVTFQGGTALASAGASAAATAAAKSALFDMTIAKIKVASVLLLGVTAIGSGIGVATTNVLSSRSGEPGDPVAIVTPTQNTSNGQGHVKPKTNRIGMSTVPVKPLRGMIAAGPIRNAQLANVDAIANDGQSLASVGPLGITIVRKDAVTKRIPVPKQARAVSFLPQGKQLAALGDDRIVRVCDVETAKELRQIRLSVANVRSAAFSKDGVKLAVTGSDDCIHLWDIAEGTESGKLPSPAGRILGMAFSPDGQLLAIATRNSVVVRNLADRTQAFRHVADGRAFRQPVFSADSKRLAFADEGALAIAEVATGQVQHFTGDVKDISAMAFSPSGDRIALREGVRSIRVWDLRTGKETRTFDLPAGATGVLAFSPDGKCLHSGGCTFSVEDTEAVSAD